MSKRIWYNGVRYNKCSFGEDVIAYTSDKAFTRHGYRRPHCILGPELISLTPLGFVELSNFQFSWLEIMVHIKSIDIETVNVLLELHGMKTRKYKSRHWY